MKFFSKSQIFGVVLATLVAFGIIGCGDGGLSCDSQAVREKLTPRIELGLSKMGVPSSKLNQLEMGGWRDFKTNSTDKENKRVACEATFDIKFQGKIETQILKYSVLYDDNGEIVYIDIKWR